MMNMIHETLHANLQTILIILYQPTINHPNTILNNLSQPTLPPSSNTNPQQPLRLLSLPLQLPPHLLLPTLILPPAHLQQMHLIRSIRNPQRPHPRPHIRQGRILTNAHSAIRLHRTINNPTRHRRNHNLSLSNLLQRALRIPLINLNRRIQHNQPRRINLNPRLSNPLQNHPVRRQILPERLLPLVVDPRNHPLQGLLSRPDGPHRVVDTSGSQSTLDDFEAAAFAQNDVGRRHPHVLECDVSVPVRGIVVPVHG